MKCPKCGIRAAKHAISCFCGYEFVQSSTSNDKIDESINPEVLQTEQDKGEREASAVDEQQEAAQATADSEQESTAHGTVDVETDPADVPEQESYQQPRFDDSVPRYDKVGGWLLLLCVSLTILGPLATFYNLTAGYSEVKGLFEATPGLKTLYNIYTFLSIGLGLLF